MVDGDLVPPIVDGVDVYLCLLVNLLYSTWLDGKYPEWDPKQH